MIRNKARGVRDETVFVGREAELVLLNSALEEARRGSPRVVSIEGPAGVGKTALLSVFRNYVEAAQVFLISGEESETILPLGIIDQLIRQLRPKLSGSHRAIDRLAAHTSAGEFEPFRIGTSLLEILGEIQERGPILLIIEDAHWADLVSLQALTFAFRRLHVDRVLLIISVRTEQFIELPSGLRRLLEEDGSFRIALSGLMPAEVRRLTNWFGWQLSSRGAQRLHGHTHGNPLYIKALLNELDPGALEHDWDELLPSPRSFSEIVLEKLERCTPDSRQLIEAAAVLGVRIRVEHLLLLVELHEPLAALDEAVAAGLVRVERTPVGNELQFEHPLVHAAVYHSLLPGRRVALHRAAAAVVEEEALALRHLAASQSATNPELAARIEAFARSQMLRASWSSAASAMISAAQLTGTPQDRDRCILDAIDCQLLAGEVATANALAGDMTQYSPSARRDYVMGRLRQLGGSLPEAEQFFATAWMQLEAATEQEPELAARIAGWHATLLVNSGRATEGIEWARRALHALPAEDVRCSLAMSILLVGLASRGDTDEVLHLVSWLPKCPDHVAPQYFEQLLGRGIARLWSDQLIVARSDLSKAVDLARERGAAHLLVPALFYLADTEYRLGDWDDAVAHGELAASTAEDSEQLFLAGCAHAIAASPHCARGCWEQAEYHVRAAKHLAEAVGDLATVGFTAVAAARLALVTADPAAAIRSLEPLSALRQEPLQEEGVLPWRLLYAEALYEQGNFASAARWLDQAEDRISKRRLLSVLVTARRLRGQLEAQAGRLDRARAEFDMALHDAETVNAPFEIARLELTYGSLLRRTGHQRAAKTRLQAARNAFLKLRAGPFVERCDVELAGTGLRPVRRTHDQRNLLTSQELTVARLVSEGLTNREVAAHLVLSPRTVEYHLLHVFAKLGINSRSQLVRHMLGHR